MKCPGGALPRSWRPTLIGTAFGSLTIEKCGVLVIRRSYKSGMLAHSYAPADDW